MDTNVKTTVEPLGDRILVQVLEDAKISAGGVHIPDQARERPQRGKVLAVGKGLFHPELRTEVERPIKGPTYEGDDGVQTLPAMLHSVETGGYEPMPVQEGEVVLFSKYAGTEVPGGGLGGPMDRVQQLILRAADLLGVERYWDEDGSALTREAFEAIQEAASPVAPGERYEVVAVVPEGMKPMPRTGAETPYELITRTEAVERGLTEPGRTQELRDGFVYDFQAQAYWLGNGTEAHQASEEREAADAARSRFQVGERTEGEEAGDR